MDEVEWRKEEKSSWKEKEEVRKRKRMGIRLSFLKVRRRGGNDGCRGQTTEASQA